jgi:hypothetical protein
LGDRWDILEQEEIEFNERDIRYIGESVDKLQNKMIEYIKELNSSMTEIEEELQEKRNLLKEMKE